MTASMLRRTEPVVSLVPRFERRVQSKRAGASASWTRRFAKKSVAGAIDSLRSAARVTAATRTARRRAVRRRGPPQSAPRASVIAAVLKDASIIGITSGPTVPA